MNEKNAVLAALKALGEKIIAAHTASYRVIINLMQPLSTLATACSTFVSQNYGAKNITRIRRGDDFCPLQPEDVLAENDVHGAKVRVVDRGALECVIRARVETAIKRGRE